MKLIMMAAALMLGGAAAAQVPCCTKASPSPRTTAIPSATPAASRWSRRPARARGLQPARADGPRRNADADRGARRPRPAAGPLPPCTRTVTDRCTQTYERGRAR